MTDPDHAPAARPREDVSPLKAAVREARIEAAEQTGVVIDLHDAELARLEILNEALNPVFADIPAGRSTLRSRHHARPSAASLDRLVAHVEMGRDKRVYRFLLDYALRPPHCRRVDRGRADRSGGHALCGASSGRARTGAGSQPARDAAETRVLRGRAASRGRRGFGVFVFGMLAGAAALLALAWFLGPRY